MAGGGQVYKLLFLGDSGTGKTTFLKRYTTGLYDKVHLATARVTTQDLELNTTRGEISFSVWETPAKHSAARLYRNTQCAVILFDLTNHSTFRIAANILKALMHHCDDIPVVLCGNKSDLPDKEVQRGQVEKLYRNLSSVVYVELSVKTHENLDEPFRWISSRLREFDDIELVPFLAPIPPPVIAADPDVLQGLLEAANLAPLPDDADDDW